MEKKVVLYIGGFELPDKNAAAHRVLNNAKILKELGYEVLFIGIDQEEKVEKKGLAGPKDIQGFLTYSLPYPKTKKQWMKRLIDIEPYTSLINQIGRVDAIIFYNYYSIVMERMIGYCKRKGILCMADITEWYSPYGHSIRDYVRRVDVFFSMRFIHKKMDAIISISEYLNQYYNCVNKKTCIPALVDKAEKKWKESIYNTKLTDQFKLVYAGTPEKKDRIDFLVSALKLVKRNYILDVVGITKEQYLDMYPKDRTFIEESGNIVFHGRLSHLDTLEIVKMANYSCFFREDNRVSKAGFPTKFVEAISCGTPVITNCTSNIVDFIKPNRNGILLDNLQLDSIVKAIENAPYTMCVESDLFDYRYYIGRMKSIF